VTGYGFPRSRLVHSEPFGPFEIRHHEPDYLGGGRRGVAHPLLIDKYLLALNNSFGMFIRYFNRPSPKTPIIVNIFNTADIMAGANGGFSYLDQGDVPTICLPCGSGNTPNQLELDEAEAEVLHEMTHVFNWSARPPQLSSSQAWLWLDEALAILVEHKYGAGPQLFHQGMTHAYSLDNAHAGEFAALFASFLEFESAQGLESIFRMWDLDTFAQHPTEIIGEDIFLSCFHRFAKSIFFRPTIFHGAFARALHRMAPEVLELTADAPNLICTGTLDHLTFRSFDCRIGIEMATCVEIRLVAYEQKWDRLMASAIPVCAGKDQQIEAGLEHRLFGDDSSDMETLKIPLQDLAGEPVLRIAIVISNCGTRGDEDLLCDGTPSTQVYKEHDDAVGFELRLAAT